MSQLSVKFEVKLAFLITILILVSMWAYHGTTGNLFVWDTANYLFKNISRLSSLGVDNLWWMATSLEGHNWHPLTWFSWAIDYHLYGGLDPWGFHFSNNFFHALNSVLVFVLILTVLGLVHPVSVTFTVRKDNNALTAAFLTSLLFAVHPQHVESVAWVAERKDLLFQIFLLLSLLTYAKYVTCDQLIKARWYLVTLSLFIFAALSKPMAVTFPAILLLVDIYPLRRTGLTKPVFGSVHQVSYFGLLIEKIPFFLVSSIIVLMTLKAAGSKLATTVELSLIERIVNAIHSTVFYLKNFLLPLWLSPLYPFFQVSGSGSVLKALLIFTIFSTITLAAFWAWRKQKRAWLIAWVFYLVTLLPVLGLIQIGPQGAADRFVYFPTLPFYLLIAGGIFLLLKKGNSIKKIILILIITLVISLSVIQTGKQIRVWQSEFTLWTHVIELYPNNKLAHANLGIFYKNQADFERAALEFEAEGGDDSWPDSTFAWRAITYMHLGRHKEAIENLFKLGMIAESKPELNADSNCIQYNIAWSFAHLEMYQESIDLFARVAPNSGLGSDASVWVLALNDSEKQNDKAGLNKELPGICENLIPSSSKLERIR